MRNLCFAVYDAVSMVAASSLHVDFPARSMLKARSNSTKSQWHGYCERERACRSSVPGRRATVVYPVQET